MATEPAAYGYEVHTDVDVSASGEMLLSAWLVGVDGAWPEGERGSTPVELVIVGDGLEGAIRCGDDETPLPVVALSEVSPGALKAVELDAVGGRGSALNYPRGGLSPESQSFGAPLDLGSVRAVQVTYQAQMYRNDEEPAQYHAVNEAGIWVQECRLGPEVSFRSDSANDPMAARQSTFLAPQVNWASINGELRAPDGVEVAPPSLAAKLWLERRTGVTLAESYPSPQARTEGWAAWYGVSQTSGISHTDQPTWMLQNRETARNEDMLLVFSSLGAGLGLALFASGLGNLFDATVGMRQARREP